MLIGIQGKLLLSRLLTRSGDQAWDFVVPFALLHVFPGKIQIAAFYYLMVKVGTFLFTASVGKWIDRSDRRRVVQAGVGTQFLAVLIGMSCFWFLDKTIHGGALLGDTKATLLFVLLCGAGVLASLGSIITEIAVGNDLAPSLLPPEQLTGFNAWMRRIDLGTEVVAPIIAGLLYALESSQIHLFGLVLIAVWNLISFVPEYWLLSHVVAQSRATKVSVPEKKWSDIFHVDIKFILRQPIFILMLSYSFLWLSVLSPHGVLLSAYLKDQVSLPENEIGLFRGLGAIFGLISTLSFPYWVKRWGLIESAKAHLMFQGFVLVLGLWAFSSAADYGIYIFLICILLSRIGLYGFSNGEFELRQRLIPENQRGEINSLSYLMTTLATLVLYSAGSLLPETQDFKYLVYGSVVAVILANIFFLHWSKTSAEL